MSKSSSVSNNSIKLKYTASMSKIVVFQTIQFNDQTVLFQASQFSVSYLFALSLNVKQFYLTYR